MRSRDRFGTVAGAIALVALVVLSGCSAQDEMGARRDAVAARGAEVMPFDLDATTHTFTKAGDGGLQVVTADAPTDARQIDLIRQHLSAERAKFAAGDFADPARIHGMDMPGVAELREGHARVTVTYRERNDGAELRYTTTDPALVSAIHAWFDRQVMDHGTHATAQ